MNYNFGDSNIITCYIKELLHSFNLPSVPVLTKETEPINGRTYIRDNKLVNVIDDHLEYLADYNFNKKIVNVTKNLRLNSDVYDSDTHEYLGDYLRFIRDYKGVDLMKMYNCFSNRKPLNIQYPVDEALANKRLIDTKKDSYTYYLVPVKFNMTYSLYLDCPSKYELMCLFYKDFFVEKSEELIDESYRIIGGSSFKKPLVYSTYFDSVDELYPYESVLYLLLKMPRGFKSSVVILENSRKETSMEVAEFRRYRIEESTNDKGIVTRHVEWIKDLEGNDLYDEKEVRVVLSSGSMIDGSMITECIYGDDATDISSPVDIVYNNSLLRVNDGNCYPFADRLVEYLLGQAITPADYLRLNIIRIQDKVDNYGYSEMNDKVNHYKGLWDNDIRKVLYNKALDNDNTRGFNTRYGCQLVELENDFGFNEKLLPKRPKKYIDIYRDFTGYVDKDVEMMTELM